MTKLRFLLLRDFDAFIISFAIFFRVCIKVIIPSGLIGVYEFSRNLSDPSFQFCQTVIRSLRLSLADTNHSRDMEPKKRIVASVGRNNITVYNYELTKFKMNFLNNLILFNRRLIAVAYYISVEYGKKKKMLYEAWLEMFKSYKQL